MLDTNVLLVSISRRSKYRPIVDALRLQEYDLLVTSNILLEYEEIIGLQSSAEVAGNFLNALQNFSNVHRVNPRFQFRLIPQDPDDEKFVDCAVAGQADFLVTNDAHFRQLVEVKFPQVKVLTAQAFLELLVL
ncbi:putative PIN family toxin of toxin-antitoxin system [Hymenobacter luteus]|uniref:Putative PIN family toxin of toxin-antitoxin system n=1 Tax=Hymenobacter luteus TaxID=1411122 RepID=A0A7W9SWN7_9BACT|nr:putative PIN family toxin of toxin-antitoxin system [Hymenobacter luteus]